MGTKPIFIDGGSVGLRLLERDDLYDPVYLQWVNDQEVTRFLEVGTFPTSIQELEKFFWRNQPPNHILFAIMTDWWIGTLKLDIRWRDRVAELGIMIGRTQEWGKGYGTEATELAIKYAFERLGMQKLTLGVLLPNGPAHSMYVNAGFEEEAHLEREVFCEGMHEDVIRMRLFKCDWSG